MSGKKDIKQGLRAVPKHIRLSVVNNVLLTLIVIINGYIILAPQLPKIEFWWRSNHTEAKQTLTKQIHAPVAQTPTNQPNTLIVPSMLLKTPILEAPISDTYKVLDKGIWRWPLGSTPDKGSNTVLVGHRFTYTNPKGIFYDMDKVQTGDEIGLMWDNKTYFYRVISVREVEPTETSVTDATPDARLTMYTCTPLWNPKNRLVVTATLESKV